ncbi:MAG TPA: acylphosphatase [Polyangiaceae bacterium]|nr:acylphosphatase [Polyangiaceae bacterium]
MGGKKAVRAVVRGRVQGVFFRAATQQKARELGVVGWVENLPDGGVAFHAEGEAGAVDALVAWARRGPQLARVDALELEAAAAGEFGDFSVRR